MVTSNGRFSKSKRRQIEEFLLNPESVRFSRDQIAQKFNCTTPYVSRIAGKLGQARRYHKSTRDRIIDPSVKISLRPPAPTSPIAIPDGAESLRTIVSKEQVDAIVHSSTLSADQQRQSLSWLAINASRDEAKVAAHRALQTLDANLGLQTKLGPGEPLSDEDKIFRLSLLMQACGKEIVHAAQEKAFALPPSPEPEPSPSVPASGDTPTPSGSDLA